MSNSEIKRKLQISLNKVKRWRSRWAIVWPSLNQYEPGFEGQVPKDHDLVPSA